MKVYIVMAFDAEPYSDSPDWVDSVWDSYEKAQDHIKKNRGVQGAKPENFDFGYCLSQTVVEKEVQ